MPKMTITTTAASIGSFYWTLFWRYSTPEFMLLSRQFWDDDADYLCFKLFPHEPSVPPNVQRVLICLYIITAILTLLGNAIVIVVQLLSKKSSRNIRKYLFNLAVADIVTGVVTVPFNYSSFVFREWNFQHWLCGAVQFAQLLSVFIISMTLTVIGIERYIATLHPFSSIYNSLKTYSSSIIATIWITGCFYAYIPNQHITVEPFTFTEGYKCVDLGPKKPGFLLFDLVITFLIPLIILGLAYTAIMRQLLNRASQPPPTLVSTFDQIGSSGGGSGEGRVIITPDEEQQTRQTSITLRRSVLLDHRKRTIKMIFVLIIVFTICWFPVKMLQFLVANEILKPCTEREYYIVTYIYIVAQWLATANSFINPVIYSFMSQRFRNDFFKITKIIRDKLQRRGTRSGNFPEFRTTRL